MKKKYLIYGNCQCSALEALLSRAPLFFKKFQPAGSIKPVHLLVRDDKEDLYSLISQVDLFIFQNVKIATTPSFTTNEIIKYLKNDCIKICIPNIFFRGYQPEISYIKSLSPKIDRFIPYHDLNILREYVLYKTSCNKRCEDLILDPQTYSKKFIINNYNKTIGELRDRESLCDIIISNYIENNWEKERLFYSMNHPTNEVLIELAKRLLKFIGISGPIVTNPKPYLNLVVLPIYKSITSFIGISFEEKLKVRNNIYSISEYIQKACEVYTDFNIPELGLAIKSMIKKTLIVRNKPKCLYGHIQPLSVNN